jgi:hypothetical protein
MAPKIILFRLVWWGVVTYGKASDFLMMRVGVCACI